MEPQTPPSTPPHQHVATPHAASPATAMAARQYNEAIASIASIALNSPKPPKTPRSCRSVWQAHGDIAVPQSTKRVASSFVKFKPSMKKRKRSSSPPPLDRNSKPKSE